MASMVVRSREGFPIASLQESEVTHRQPNRAPADRDHNAAQFARDQVAALQTGQRARSCSPDRATPNDFAVASTSTVSPLTTAIACCMRGQSAQAPDNQSGGYGDGRKQEQRPSTPSAASFLGDFHPECLLRFHHRRFCLSRCATLAVRCAGKQREPLKHWQPRADVENENRRTVQRPPEPSGTPFMPRDTWDEASSPVPHRRAGSNMLD